MLYFKSILVYIFWKQSKVIHKAGQLTQNIKSSKTVDLNFNSPV